jgi:hypothetical protein
VISLKGKSIMKGGIKANPVPKQGNLSDPNKWQGVILMDMCSKVFLSVMTARAFTSLDEHSTHFQFGRTSGMGCRDGLFVRLLSLAVGVHWSF